MSGSGAPARTDDATMADNPFPGLDYDFLRFVGVRPESQRQIQSFYLQWLEQCAPVLDLGCGDGDFLAMLQEHGVAATGVDGDEKSYRHCVEQGLDVRLADVFDYLPSVEPGSVGGIFSSHLVEHLPYELVIRLISLSYRALRPGGLLILTTPDVRTLFSHLEMFYLHFGHVSFYHPRLLQFLMEHEGFVDCAYGTNEATSSPLLPQIRALAAVPDAPGGEYTVEMRPLSPSGSRIVIEEPARADRMSPAPDKRIGRLIRGGDVRALTQEVRDLRLEIAQLRSETRLLEASSRSEAERVAAWTQEHVRQVSAQLRGIAQDVQSMNGPFECYAIGRKPQEPGQEPAQ